MWGLRRTNKRTPPNSQMRERRGRETEKGVRRRPLPATRRAGLGTDRAAAGAPRGARGRGSRDRRGSSLSAVADASGPARPRPGAFKHQAAVLYPGGSYDVTCQSYRVFSQRGRDSATCCSSDAPGGQCAERGQPVTEGHAPCAPLTWGPAGGARGCRRGARRSRFTGRESGRTAGTPHVRPGAPRQC